ncbi:hypothetical protein BJ508DRAFT_151864 [Ascobolus immersus RN42]|uniref:Uncharacterized protein n=1 Tax=Ascobolus immersus RN42 TaxID=1160509 RepID=A0A3N4I3U7_ASCIM|nr:hypothetical protein BJ508DRAFT_151864 [Ascobolus immersus RN42]
MAERLPTYVEAQLELSAKRRFKHEDYRIGWICPLEIEQMAALKMLDDEHEGIPKQPGDFNIYTLGSINGHNVVLAGQYSTGNTAAAVVTTQMRLTFPEIKFILLVGIGGGVPTAKVKLDYLGCRRVRLGDVVVSEPNGKNSGAIQYDRGKALAGGIFERTGALDSPPAVLRNAVRELSIRRQDGLITGQDPISNNLSRVKLFRQFRFPGPERDLLFQPDYQHVKPGSSCKRCDKTKLETADSGSNSDTDSDSDSGSDKEDSPFDRSVVAVHRGTIASGEMVVKDAELRDKLASDDNILCFEMEAAGVLSGFPCLIVRGISDYCDSHKNDRWHGYAAATAAAYARQLFFHMAVDEVRSSLTPEMENDIRQIKVRLEDDQLRKIIKILSPLRPEEKQRDFRRRRVAGTGRTFLESSVFQKWKSWNPIMPTDGTDGPYRSRTQLLFCHGGPGVGKSFLCSAVIDLLESTAPITTKKRESTIYMYSDYTDNSNQTPVAILGCLIRQLISDPACPQAAIAYVIEYENSLPNGFDLGSMGLCFEALLSAYSKVYLCIDGLDECKESTLQWIVEFVESILRFPSVSVLLTARSIVHQRYRASLFCKFFHISTDNADIKLYIEQHIITDSKRRPNAMSKDLKQRIVKKLSAISEGTFLLAALQLDVVLHGLNIHQRELLLDDISESLDATFSRTIKRIQEQDKHLRQIAFSALQWMTFARAPLTKDDLETALAVDIDDLKFYSKNVTDLQTILDSCLGLLLYNSESDTILLFHFSVQEYLLMHREEYFPYGDYRIGETCLAFICFPIFFVERHRDNWRWPLFLELHYSFFLYASFFWFRHIESGNMSCPEHTQTQSNRLFRILSRRFEKRYLWKRTPIALAMLHLFIAEKSSISYRNSLDGGLKSEALSNTQSLYSDYCMFRVADVPRWDNCMFRIAHVLAGIGFGYTLSALLDRFAAAIDFSPDEQTSSTPLHYAVASMNLACVDTLLRLKHRSPVLDVASRNLDGNTALEIAAQLQLSQIVRLLLPVSELSSLQNVHLLQEAQTTTLMNPQKYEITRQITPIRIYIHPPPQA